MSDSYEEVYIYGHFTGFIDFLFMSLGFARNGKTRDGRCQDEDGARDYSQIGIIPAGYKTADRSSLSRRDGYHKINLADSPESVQFTLVISLKP
jgi:hypothetical protein